MEYILGIDQGGSKTVGVLTDINGNILAVGYSYGSCHSVQGIENAMNAILEVIDEIRKTVDYKNEELIKAVCGLTGADFAYEYDYLKHQISKYTGIEENKIRIVNDCIGALRGGTHEKYGGVICVGTGINIGLLNKNGEEIILGYYIDDDHQGGTALGKKTILAVFNDESGFGEKTMLTSKVLEYYNCNDVDELLQRYIFDDEIKKSLKNLTYILFECVEEDEVAYKIIKDMSKIWSKYIVAACKKLDMDYEFELVLSGGVFKEKTGLIEKNMLEAMNKELKNIKGVIGKYEPVVGTVKLAFDELGLDTEENINATSKKFNLERF